MGQKRGLIDIATGQEVSDADTGLTYAPEGTGTNGALKFEDLENAPSLAGKGGHLLKVNTGGDAVDTISQTQVQEGIKYWWDNGTEQGSQSGMAHLELGVRKDEAKVYWFNDPDDDGVGTWDFAFNLDNPGGDTDAIHDNVAGEITAVAAKATPVGADVVLIEDSEAGNVKKKVALSNMLGSDGDAVHTNVAGEITGVAAKATPVGADVVLIEDSEAANVKKKVALSNMLGSDANAIHDNVAGEIAAVAAKATPVGADVVLIEDSEAANAKKRVALSNMLGSDANAIHDNVSGEIAALASKATPVAADSLVLEDSEAGNAKKKLLISNLPAGGGGLNLAPFIVVGLADQGDTASDCDYLHDNSATPGNPPDVDGIKLAFEALRDSGQAGLIYIRRGTYETEVNNVIFTNPALIVGEGKGVTILRNVQDNPVVADNQPWFCGFQGNGGGMRDLKLEILDFTYVSGYPDAAVINWGDHNHFDRVDYEPVTANPRFDNAVIRSFGCEGLRVRDCKLDNHHTNLGNALLHLLEFGGSGPFLDAEVSGCTFIPYEGLLGNDSITLDQFESPSTWTKINILHNRFVYPLDEYSFSTSGSYAIRIRGVSWSINVFEGLNIHRNEMTENGGGFITAQTCSIRGLSVSKNDVQYSDHGMQFLSSGYIEGVIEGNKLKYNNFTPPTYGRKQGLIVSMNFECLRVVNNHIDIGNMAGDPATNNAYVTGIAILNSSSFSEGLLVEGNQIEGSGENQSGIHLQSSPTQRLQIKIKNNTIRLTGVSAAEGSADAGIYVAYGPHGTEIEGNNINYASPYGAAIHIVGNSTTGTSSLGMTISNNVMDLQNDSANVYGLWITGQRSVVVPPWTYYTDRSINRFACMGNTVLSPGANPVPFFIVAPGGYSIAGSFVGNVTNQTGLSTIPGTLSQAANVI